MLDGFKKFILRRNVVDMAVGVVIGAAFGGLVNSLTKGLLTPFVGGAGEGAGLLQSQVQGSG
jgi:large conductance mechanosensitive channel